MWWVFLALSEAEQVHHTNPQTLYLYRHSYHFMKLDSINLWGVDKAMRLL